MGLSDAKIMGITLMQRISVISIVKNLFINVAHRFRHARTLPAAFSFFELPL